MKNWYEIKELTNYHKTLAGKIPDLEKELENLMERVKYEWGNFEV